jgi:aspartate racemase
MSLIAAMQSEGRWEDAGAWLALEALRLERAGAEVLALATNTMHKCALQITAAVSVPFLHIADPLISSLQADGRNRPLLLGTRFTMEDRFFLERLEAAGLEPLVPTPADRKALHIIIYEELCKGVVSDTAVEAIQQMVSDGRLRGADSLILGCTELCMLTKHGPLALHAYDTTALHAGALVDFSLRRVAAAQEPET